MAGYRRESWPVMALPGHLERFLLFIKSNMIFCIYLTDLNLTKIKHIFFCTTFVLNTFSLLFDSILNRFLLYCFGFTQMQFSNDLIKNFIKKKKSLWHWLAGRPRCLHNDLFCWKAQSTLLIFCVVSFLGKSKFKQFSWFFLLKVH